MNTGNPHTNRIIAYVILFTGIICFALGVPVIEKGQSVAGYALCIIGLLICTAAVIWAFKKVRCPHCGALLQLKLYRIKECPHCGKKTY